MQQSKNLLTPKRMFNCVNARRMPKHRICKTCKGECKRGDCRDE